MAAIEWPRHRDGDVGRGDGDGGRARGDDGGAQSPDNEVAGARRSGHSALAAWHTSRALVRLAGVCQEQARRVHPELLRLAPDALANRLRDAGGRGGASEALANVSRALCVDAAEAYPELGPAPRTRQSDDERRHPRARSAWCHSRLERTK